MTKVWGFGLVRVYLLKFKAAKVYEITWKASSARNLTYRPNARYYQEADFGL